VHTIKEFRAIDRDTINGMGVFTIPKTNTGYSMLAHSIPSFVRLYFRSPGAIGRESSAGVLKGVGYLMEILLLHHIDWVIQDSISKLGPAAVAEQ